MNKRNWIVMLALVLIVAMLTTGCSLFKPKGNNEIKNFTVTITHKDGTQKVLNCTSDAQMVGDYLLSEGIVKGENGQYGLYIHEADGEQAIAEEDGAYWAFYIDGEYALTGIDQTVLEDGKHYELRYEVFQ